MILTAHQPLYLPWLGLFHKISLAEKFCIFDIAQYQTKEFNNRNRIKTPTGVIWLSVPVESKDHYEKRVCDVKIIPGNWNRKHFKSIYIAYKKSPHFDRYIGDLETILTQKQYTFLSDLNFELLSYFLKQLQIEVPIVKASDYDFQGKKSDLVMDMCMKLGASDYIFGSQGKDYADREAFKANNINIYFQNYNHPTYNQLHGVFEPYLSVLDLLFNEGEKSRSILLDQNAKTLAELDR